MKVVVTKPTGADGVEYTVSCPEVGIVDLPFVCNTPSRALLKGHFLVVDHVRQALRTLEHQEPFFSSEDPE